ncbi:hypothetical protein DACRYDRAFT_23461 [Dacryopinax primogenitus]|uniref:Coatomer subunit epsilon n=1 Tax=Dacryopinax primogenitus (strain DJM 731) TaxID=1858805 RepID=M5FUJ5_DACPD|nr:uncharacterized protein DACRYDRAFT_23461 [Dacryopinax primogenitus]EJT99913.1 hypothetical protein DACRYDRAFT_23461 [Dacryopinax primogenitus]
MDSEELYQLKSHFYQANYKAVLSTPLPPANSPSYLPSKVYNLRAQLALSPSTPLPAEESESLALRAVAAFSGYLTAEDKAAALEELRELVLEVEGEEELGWEEGVVRVLSATAFFREGETEEALDTLSGETAKKDLECVALTAQIQLCLNRADLAQKTLESAKKWADDALLLQLVEAWVSLRTIPPNYNSAYYTFLELTTVPSPSAPMLANRAIAQLCQGNIPEADGSLTEALEKDPEDASALMLSARQGMQGALRKLEKIQGGHPWLVAGREAETRFEEARGKWEVPPLATASA